MRIGSPGLDLAAVRARCAMMPALRTRLPSASRARVAAISPGWKLVELAARVAQPGHLDDGRCRRGSRRAPVGRPSRSTPACRDILAHLPGRHGEARRRATRRCSSAWIRCTWRRFGWLANARHARAMLDRCTLDARRPRPRARRPGGCCPAFGLVQRVRRAAADRRHDARS